MKYKLSKLFIVKSIILRFLIFSLLFKIEKKETSV